MTDSPRTIPLALSEARDHSAILKCIQMLEETANVRFSITCQPESRHENPLQVLQSIAIAIGEEDEKVVDALQEVVHRCTTIEDFGGYGMKTEDVLSSQQEADLVFLCSAYLEALKSAARIRSKPKPLKKRPDGRRGMTITEKIFAMHDVSQKGYVQPGDIIQVDVDWVLASELSWTGMERVYDSVGKPGIFRNDRFWLAGDHRVEPPLYNDPKVRRLMESSKRAQKDFKMTDFQGFNYTIMHTEFVRERAQPGMLIIGADSHSCSAGAVSCLSIGMGATDVCMPLVTGQTWFSVPKTVRLHLINKPPKGIGGKDTVLYILKSFKRNTIAADRVVEFTGPGIKFLSCDARFAISNMCTEFGAVTAVFESDNRTAEFIAKRRTRKHKNECIYFKADEDAVYADTFEVDLAQVESFVAVHPSPDNVVPVSETSDVALDGCFIGACTTAEEDLVIGALVLSAGLEQGLTPVARGRRLVVPGSKPIRNKLEKLGLLEIYRKAGFKVGVPGCSMCVGQGVDQAAPGEKWLSSQNRNFANRMGPGSLAYLGAAATVAVSSFSMKISDPRPLLEVIDLKRLENYLGYQPFSDRNDQAEHSIIYDEPYGKPVEEVEEHTKNINNPPIDSPPHSDESNDSRPSADTIRGKALVLGDFIDTDAIIPSKFLTASTTNDEFGAHCMEFFMPEFRQMVKDGLNIIVAGNAFGVGSSRDVAVNALLGAGVQCVVAKSFAFIYARNQPNIGLLGITIQDEEFYAAAQQGVDISIDLQKNEIICGGNVFQFQLSEMEKQLIAAGGLTEAFRKFHREVFDVLCRRKPEPATVRKQGVADIEGLVSQTVRAQKSSLSDVPEPATFKALKT